MNPKQPPHTLLAAAFLVVAGWLAGSAQAALILPAPADMPPAAPAGRSHLEPTEPTSPLPGEPAVTPMRTLQPPPPLPTEQLATPAPASGVEPVAPLVPAPVPPSRRPPSGLPLQAPHPPQPLQPVLPNAAQPPVMAREGRTYAPGSFHAIEIAGTASVHFVQSPVDEVFVEGDDDVQRAIALVVRDGKLTIDQDGAWKFWRAAKPRIEVRARELSRVSISGAADFTVATPLKVRHLVVRISGAGSARLDQLDAQQLEFVVDGAGDGTVAGLARDLKVRISGHSGFQGEDLRADRGSVAISGVGKVRVWARQDLDIAVAGVGRVDYWGTPAVVRRQVAGTAQITDRGAKVIAP